MRQLKWILIVGILTLLALTLWPSPVAQSNTSAEYGWLRVEEFGAVSSGDPGAATMSATSDGYIRGHIYAVHLDYAPSISDTTDVVLSAAGSPALTLLTRSNSLTDGWFYPVIQNHGSNGSTVTWYDRVAFNDRMSAAVAESTAVTYANCVTVTVYWGQ